MPTFQEPVKEFLRYYVVGPSHKLRLPSLLARATSLIVDGRAIASLAALDLFESLNEGEELLVELLYGWNLTELRELTRAAEHLERALAMAKDQQSEAGLSIGMIVAATNSLASGRRDESFRLLNRAAAIAPTGSDQSLMAIFVLSQILTTNRAPAAAEAVLLELSSAREWPPNADSKINRRLARVQIELDKITEASALADRIGRSAATDRDRIEHSIFLAHLGAALDQPALARSELDHAMGLITSIDVPHLHEDLKQARVAVTIAEFRDCTATESALEMTNAIGSLPIKDLAPRIQGMVIDALTRSGNYEQAWILSNEVARTHLDEGVDMRGVFDLTIKLNDSQAETRFADELGSKHEKLQILQTRASAVMNALAHGVRDPLTVLQLWFGEQSTDLSTTPSSRIIADAAIERVERLLDQVVWLARADRLVPRTIEPSIDLEGLANEVIGQHQHLAEFRGVSIVNLSLHRAAVGTDAPDGVAALVSALVSHSMAYCSSGDLVEIDLGIEDDKLHITVVDEGPSIRTQPDPALTQPWEVALPMARLEGGDAAGDIGLFLAQSLARLYTSEIHVNEMDDGRIRSSTSLPLRISNSRSGQML